MIKRSPSRNARSKGIKAKHVLQICLLLGVCFWLLYQVKHSHDKKKELEEKDASFSQKTLSHEVLPKLGRKDPHPGLQDKTSEKNEEEETGVDEEGNKKEENGHEKEDEEVEREEQRMHEEEEKGGEVIDHLEKEKEEQIEHEEDEQDEEANSEETNDEDRKVGDDEVDERDREKIEGEADPDGEFMDEEKEREDDGEKKESQGSEGEGKEIQGNEEEDREVQTDNETQSEGHGSDKNSHVAREEHYMADDASSAVTHDTQIISTEPEKEGLEKSNEKLAADDLQQDKYSINDNPLDVNGNKNNSMSQLEQAENGHSLNAATDEKKDDETSLAKSEEGSPNNTTVTPSNTTVMVLSSDQSVSSNKSTEVSSEAGDNHVSENLEVPGTSQQNGMLNVSESTQIPNATVDGQVTGDVANLQTTQSEQVNNGINSEIIQSDSNSTLLGQTEKAGSFGNDSSNSSSNSESGGSDKTIEKPEVTATEDVNSGFSSGTNETKEATHDENSDTIHESGGRDENTDSSTTNETVDAVIHDPNDSSDSSIGQDEKEARIDLDTLPEFGTGRVDNGNVAEE